MNKNNKNKKKNNKKYEFMRDYYRDGLSNLKMTYFGAPKKTIHCHSYICIEINL